MGAVAGLVGFGGGSDGTSNAAPGQANLTNGVTYSDLSNSAANVNTTQQQQQALLQALANQNGISNQNNSYQQMQGIANGTGPNPAQAQYQQNIQNLAKQQSGAIASMKGISPALQAQLASQQGSSAMQSAAGQGASNLATQQLGAMNSSAGIANAQVGNQIGQTNANNAAAQAQQNLYQQAAANFNNAMTSGQSSINAANAGMANTQMQGQQGLLGGLMNGEGMMSGSGGGGGGGGGMGMAAMAAAGGGQVVKMAAGGDPSAFEAPSGPQSKFGQFLASSQGSTIPIQYTQPIFSAGNSNMTDGLGGSLKNKVKSDPAKTQPAQQSQAIGNPVDGGSSVSPAAGSAPDLSQYQAPTATQAPAQMGAAPDLSDYQTPAPQDEYAKGGQVPALVSPGEMRIPASKVGQVARGKNPMSVGERIPGKPKVPGNSYANDTVKKTLKEGDVIIPNSIMQSKNPAQGAHDMISNIMAKRKARA